MLRTVAIVDPYEAGVMLAPACRLRGAGAIRIQSTAEVPAAYRETLGDDAYSAVIRHENLNRTVAALQLRGVDCVMAGSEWGVNLADRLSEALGVHSNGSRLSEARRNKLLMHRAVSARHLRTAAQFASAEITEIRDWVRQHCRWPVIVKPLSGMSADGVRLCFSEDDLHQGFLNILGHRNVLGRVNELVLVQEFISGQEYAVDTVSYAGHHQGVAFWTYGHPAPARSTAAGKWVTKELLPREGAPQRALFEYVSSVLDALEIRFGAAHSEVMLTEDGPVVIDVGARLHGGVMAHRMAHACFGTSQADRMVESYFEPQRFLDSGNWSQPLEKTAIMTLVRFPRKGILKTEPAVGTIRALPSVWDAQFNFRFGRELPEIAGLVILIHEDRKTVETDLARIREWEASELC